MLSRAKYVGKVCRTGRSIFPKLCFVKELLITRPFGLEVHTFNSKHKHHTLAFCPTRFAHAQNVASWNVLPRQPLAPKIIYKNGPSRILAILVFFGLWAYNNVFYYVLSGKCKILTILWLILTQLLLFWRVFVDGHI